jgi:hypothetical protein
LQKKINDKILKKQDYSYEIEQQNEDALIKEYREYTVYMYSNLKSKFIEPIKRNIRYSNEFNCPPEYESGLEIIKSKIIDGISLFPHFSRRIIDANSQDGMLFDFGIVHLHLGVLPDRKHENLIEGTKEILYCIFDEQFAYFLIIGEHGRWNDTELIKIVERNFPHILEPYKMKGIIDISPKVNDFERGKLRQSGINTFIQIDNEFIMSPGGGFNSAGGSINSSLNVMQDFAAYRKLQGKIIEKIEDFSYEIEEFYKIKKFDLKMIDPYKIILEDAKQKIILEVYLCDDNINVEDIKIIKSYI